MFFAGKVDSDQERNSLPLLPWRFVADSGRIDLSPVRESTCRQWATASPAMPIIASSVRPVLCRVASARDFAGQVLEDAGDLPEGRHRRRTWYGSRAAGKSSLIKRGV